MPRIRQLHESNQDLGKLQVVSLNIDNKPDNGIEYVKQNKFDWTHGFLGDVASSSTGRMLGVTSVPMYILLDRDGKVVSRGSSLETVLEQLP